MVYRPCHSEMVYFDFRTALMTSYLSIRLAYFEPLRRFTLFDGLFVPHFMSYVVIAVALVIVFTEFLLQ